ncbi:PREDICTED: thylakoid lumenal 17.9 kDa protein, chloroplastic [Tarenaya hassleriana]|uniref:thylakoid lumenal 17.9 kDa protein, chloroplastic n=1 Tax=Tarenaya hassleriana TaxID=28532 RepID=UPI00053C2F94|nr:PREDICTED: thylakoid lumenal 17.9 kDa protein, chloroplastic [Tarenaya hassleriana]
MGMKKKMSFIANLQLSLPPRAPPSPSTTITSSSSNSKPKFLCSLQKPRPSSPISLTPNIISLALALSLSSSFPALAIPSLSSSQSPTTPFTQSKFLQTGLQDGKIRPCPSINPGCVSTNPKSSSFSFPLRIPENDTEDPIQKLEEAIMNTQKNPKILALEDTPYGRYLEAVVEGGFSRDVMEFLVKGDVVSYRCMATKVTYVYPFTTAFGDSKGQEERMKKLVDQLGWYAPSFDSID